MLSCRLESRSFSPGDIIHPVPNTSDAARRCVEELKVLEKNGMSPCVWGEDALRHYGVPTGLFECVLILIPDHLIDSARQCLVDTGRWESTPLHPYLAALFALPQDKMDIVFDSFRMLRPVPHPSSRFLIALVPSFSFAHLHIDDQSTVTVQLLDSRIRIPTFAAFLDSLMDLAVSLGSRAILPGLRNNPTPDYTLYRSVYNRIAQWFNYLYLYNSDYVNHCVHVVAPRNQPLANFFADPKHNMTSRSWRTICALRGVIPMSAVEKVPIGFGRIKCTRPSSSEVHVHAPA